MSSKTTPQGASGTPQKPPRARTVPPLDNGKVKIGLLYFPTQSWHPSRDMYTLQSALLGPRSSIRVTVFDRLHAALNTLSHWRHHD